MKISEKNLMVKANVYVKNGLVTKLRGQGQSPLEFEQINTARLNNRPLSELELEHIKGLDRVVIEWDKGIEFINFSGAISKF